MSFWGDHTTVGGECHTASDSHGVDIPRKAIIARRPCLISAVFKRKALESPSLAKPRGSKAPPANVQCNVSHQLCILHATGQQNKLQSSGTCDSAQSHNRPCQDCLKGLQRQYQGGGGECARMNTIHPDTKTRNSVLAPSGALSRHVCSMPDKHELTSSMT